MKYLAEYMNGVCCEFCNEPVVTWECPNCKFWSDEWGVRPNELINDTVTCHDCYKWFRVLEIVEGEEELYTTYFRLEGNA